MRKLKCLVFLVALSVSLNACAGKATDDQPAVSFQNQIPTVKVTKQSLTQIISGTASVEQAATFIIASMKRGNFLPTVQVGDAVKAGSILGWNAGIAVTSPVNAIVVARTEKTQDIPKQFPLFSLRYDGFSLSIEAKQLAHFVSTTPILGRFQIFDGVGPSTCLSVVQVGGLIKSESFVDAQLATNHKPDNVVPEAAKQSFANSTRTLACLIDKNIEVAPGDSATLVLRMQRKKSVIALPVSAVAGRLQKGIVLRKQGNNWRNVDVGLGISDGANIEITSGLHEGDIVANISPNLDPQRR